MKLNIKRTLLVGIAFMTISSFWQLYDFAVPLMLKTDLGGGFRYFYGLHYVFG